MNNTQTATSTKLTLEQYETMLGMAGKDINLTEYVDHIATTNTGCGYNFVIIALNGDEREQDALEVMSSIEK